MCLISAISCFYTKEINVMKKMIIAVALICSIGQVFAHSSGGKEQQGCHKHSSNDVPHCH
ncbi:hypothetical protein AsACE_CH02513 [Acinetobacter schindleri]|nr:hypothetical protein AsACE_CH02513 [Acinetobacter schindleri]